MKQQRLHEPLSLPVLNRLHDDVPALCHWISPVLCGKDNHPVGIVTDLPSLLQVRQALPSLTSRTLGRVECAGRLVQHRQGDGGNTSGLGDGGDGLAGCRHHVHLAVAASLKRDPLYVVDQDDLAAVPRDQLVVLAVQLFGRDRSVIHDDDAVVHMLIDLQRVLDLLPLLIGQRVVLDPLGINSGVHGSSAEAHLVLGHLDGDDTNVRVLTGNVQRHLDQHRGLACAAVSTDDTVAALADLPVVVQPAEAR